MMCECILFYYIKVQHCLLDFCSHILVYLASVCLSVCMQGLKGGLGRKGFVVILCLPPPPLALSFPKETLLPARIDFKQAAAVVTSCQSHDEF